MIAYAAGMVGFQHVKVDALGAVTPLQAAGSSVQWPWAVSQRANGMLPGTSPVESLAGARLPSGSSNARVIRSIVMGSLLDGLVSFPYVNFGTDVNAPQTFLSHVTAGGLAAPEMSIFGMQGTDNTWTGWFAEFGNGRAQQLASGIVLGPGLTLPADIPIPQGVKSLVCVAHYRQAAAAGALPLVDVQALPRLVVPVVLCIDA